MTTPTEVIIDPRAGRRGSTFVRFLRRPAGAVSLAVIVLVLLVAVFAPLLAPHDPNFVDLALTKAPPSPAHPLGGDSAGRDVLSRLIWGTQSTLWGAFVTIFVAVIVGVPAGLAAGYFGRFFDRAASWVSDALQAIPAMIILLIVAAGTRNDFTVLMTTLGVFMAPGYFRLTRSTVLAVRNEPYIDAAKVSGLGNARILSKHIVKAVYAPVIIQTALTAGMAMGMQAGLQFLGIGGSKTPGWGAMMNDGFSNVLTNPLLLLWPSLALGITIAALAVLGSTLADVVSVRTPIARRRKTRRRGAEPETVTSSTGSIAHKSADSAVQLQNLRVNYATQDGQTVEVVHGITLDVAPGEVLGIVGESGSGKSQTVFSILDLLPAGGEYSADALWIGGSDVTRMAHADRQKLLGHEVGYIPQEPMSNLDPSYTIGYQLTEPLRSVHRLSQAAAKARALAMLDKVGIVDPARVMKSYPHQLSGGMAQRVLIAGAIAGKPSVLVADEPTTALDVTVQAEVLELLRELQQEYRMALVIVTHNFGVVADICDRVVVMRDGGIVEVGTVDRIFSQPDDPYTAELIAASLDGAASRSELDAAAVLPTAEPTDPRKAVLA
ncbi:dipeptide/oligopeptide/nickel ABC transporter permease/ATP-binding protein [Leifsonia poae]|uniref:dipeptide/oligopeptide/nickel ABC transporter permease/ATP-binding protein n=1 Tax=Leifsonia poae TaxID=110933 RepID=UPI001CBCCB05|nr:dipeptide/oligopeptide/nickel ABC transporter permease/ATP-binding protein [Leifsonia poae]